MAVYRCEVKRISRSSGRTAVAAAAYRSAERLRDAQANEGAGKVHDYRRRAPGVLYREVMAGENAPEWARNRARLWNEAERAENRRNSTTAREAIVSLPHELDEVQRIELVRGFAAGLIERYGVAVDLAIHRPDRKGDQRNHHAHLMFTTRRLDREGLKEKTRELDDRKTGPLEIEAIRELWEREQNLALERAGQLERVSRLSNREQGIEREPQPKIGETFTALGRQGFQPRVAGTWREVSRRYGLTKDSTRVAKARAKGHPHPERAARHRLERQGVARKYQRAAELDQQRARAREEADRQAMLDNAARVMKIRDGEQVAPSTLRENMRRRRAEKIEREKREAVERALEAALRQQQAEARVAEGITRDTSEAQRGREDAQQQVKDEARKLDEERQRQAEVAAMRAWERQRQEELRREREARDHANQNDLDPGRVMKPPGPGGSG